MNCPLTPHVERLVDLAIEEDLGRGDITTESVAVADVAAVGRIEARESLVVCGLDLAGYVFARVDPELEVDFVALDGERCEAGQTILRVSGSAQAILEAERTVLNFLMRLSGVATSTRRFVDLVAATGAEARVVDTRKTLPGWRVLDKYAVGVGGGGRHRVDLGSGILIKDNHIAACGSVTEAVRRAQTRGSHALRVETEVTTLEELAEALEAGAEVVLLDNMDTDTLRRAVEQTAGRARLEASGGVNEETIADIAQTGVDYISVGRLTHSARAMDMALELTPEA